VASATTEAATAMRRTSDRKKLQFSNMGTLLEKTNEYESLSWGAPLTCYNTI